MRPNPKEIADLVSFTEETLNRKLHSLCSNGYFLHPFLLSNGRIIIMIILFTVTNAKGQVSLEKRFV